MLNFCLYFPKYFFNFLDKNTQNAIKAAIEKGISKKKTVQQFGIPRATLVHKMSGKVPLR